MSSPKKNSNSSKDETPQALRLLTCVGGSSACSKTWLDVVLLLCTAFEGPQNKMPAVIDVGLTDDARARILHAINGIPADSVRETNYIWDLIGVCSTIPALKVRQSDFITRKGALSAQLLSDGAREDDAEARRLALSIAQASAATFAYDERKGAMWPLSAFLLGAGIPVPNPSSHRNDTPGFWTTWPAWQHALLSFVSMNTREVPLSAQAYASVLTMHIDKTRPLRPFPFEENQMMKTPTLSHELTSTPRAAYRRRAVFTVTHLAPSLGVYINLETASDDDVSALVELLVSLFTIGGIPRDGVWSTEGLLALERFLVAIQVAHAHLPYDKARAELLRDAQTQAAQRSAATSKADAPRVPEVEARVADIMRMLRNASPHDTQTTKAAIQALGEQYVALRTALTEAMEGKKPAGSIGAAAEAVAPAVGRAVATLMEKHGPPATIPIDYPKECTLALLKGELPTHICGLAPFIQPLHPHLPDLPATDGDLFADFSCVGYLTALPRFLGPLLEHLHYTGFTDVCERLIEAYLCIGRRHPQALPTLVQLAAAAMEDMRTSMKTSLVNRDPAACLRAAANGPAFTSLMARLLHSSDSIAAIAGWPSLPTNNVGAPRLHAPQHTTPARPNQRDQRQHATDTIERVLDMTADLNCARGPFVVDNGAHVRWGATLYDASALRADAGNRKLCLTTALATGFKGALLDVEQSHRKCMCPHLPGHGRAGQGAHAPLPKQPSAYRVHAHASQPSTTQPATPPAPPEDADRATPPTKRTRGNTNNRDKKGFRRPTRE